MRCVCESRIAGAPMPVRAYICTAVACESYQYRSRFRCGDFVSGLYSSEVSTNQPSSIHPCGFNVSNHLFLKGLDVMSSAQFCFPINTQIVNQSVLFYLVCMYLVLVHEKPPISVARVQVGGALHASGGTFYRRLLHFESLLFFSLFFVYTSRTIISPFRRPAPYYQLNFL